MMKATLKCNNNKGARVEGESEVKRNGEGAGESESQV